MSHNSFTSLPEEISSLKKLISIDLSWNRFQIFPNMLQRLPALSTIDLSSNEISEVNTDNFVYAQSLDELTLSNNPLRDDVVILLQSIVRIKIIL